MILSACRKRWCLSSCKKSYLSLTSFLKYYKDIANLLFLVFWVCFALPNINDSTTLQENLIPLVLLEKLVFQVSCNMIGQEHFGWQRHNKNFARYRVCYGKSIIKRTFILQMTTFSKKYRTPNFLGPFCSNLGKNDFSQKSGSATF